MGGLSIRIVGTGAEVAEAALRVGLVMTVLRTSRPRPRRDGDGVSVYLDVQLPPVPAAGPERPEGETE